MSVSLISLDSDNIDRGVGLGVKNGGQAEKAGYSILYRVLDIRTLPTPATTPVGGDGWGPG